MTQVTDEAAPTQSENEASEKNVGFAARFATPSEEGPAISAELVVSYLIGTKLGEKELSETADQYIMPSNCQNLVVPNVNPLI